VTVVTLTILIIIPFGKWQWGNGIRGWGTPNPLKVLTKRLGEVYTGFYCICVCLYIMGSQKERVERLQILAKMKKQHEQDETSEVLSRHLLEDYMIQMWYLGHQTRSDYLEVLFRSQKRDE
tara:strand:+ start:144 stop:506 length:363 start_codon:yes stop_codon:yes gene_type:complete